MDYSTFEQRRMVLKDFKYLPLFYMIPYEIAHKRKLDEFPRNPYAAASCVEWREVYSSALFQTTLADTWGWMMWQCLGIRGGVDNYSINDPFVRVTFNMPLWMGLLAEMGITTDFLAAQEPDTEIPFLTMEQAAHNCDQIAKRFWNHPALKMREMRKIVHEHRAHGDFSSMQSHVKMDFLRKYNHTRASTKVTPYINPNGKIIYAPYAPSEFVEVETRIWFDGFLKRLGSKDREIVRLLEEGYTQEETATMLGYANHSGVCKRIKAIRREFGKFRKEERE